MTLFLEGMLQQWRSAYELDGFVIVPGLIPPERLADLREAADRVTEKGRSGEWSQVRVVGKQFPPWPSSDSDEYDVWGIQNIMHPDLGEDVFTEWYGSKDLLAVSRALMGVDQSMLQFELFNLLVNPLRSSYALSWHRDDVKATATPEEESEALAIKHHGIQWNCALYDDECLTIVPGSHRRIRTDGERLGNTGEQPMPGAVTCALIAGETVFYNNNLLHVGKYDAQTTRRTLHGCYGCSPEGDTTRARNILQHDLKYARDPGFRASLSDELRPMLDKLNRLQDALEGQAIEYSQDL